MSRFLLRLAFPVALALLGFGSAGFARASLLAFDDLTSAELVPSSLPALLGPINEFGRNGWQCRPERAAKTADPRAADLPSEDGR